MQTELKRQMLHLQEYDYIVKIEHSPTARFTQCTIQHEAAGYVWSGVSRCNADDEFDYEFGANLAFMRAVGELTTSFAEAYGVARDMYIAMAQETMTLAEKLEKRREGEHLVEMAVLWLESYYAAQVEFNERDVYTVGEGW